MPNLTRRHLLVGAAALAAAGPAAAQSYDPDADPGIARDPYGRPMPGTREPGAEDPFWTDPYGHRRRGDGEAPAAPQEQVGGAPRVGGGVDYERAYAAVTNDAFPIPAFRWRRANPVFLRQVVAYNGPHEPGTVIVDPRAHHLTLVYGGGTAMRYGVGVGRQGFSWAGTATINSKQAWPDWYPPKEMLERQPELARQMSKLQSGIGMAGGPRNPLGARAMYLWQNNKDTLYRIHGTTEPNSIGKSVSSGCIRMINQDAIDLYNRVPVGAKVIVLS